MRNIQVIDGAMNSSYDIFSCTDEEFLLIFPDDTQNIEFIEDVVERDPKNLLADVFSRLWKNPVRKPDACGIHGTLFYELSFKKEFYPTKREADLDRDGRGWRHG